jgi:hypothetical protein
MCCKVQLHNRGDGVLVRTLSEADMLRLQLKEQV